MTRVVLAAAGAGDPRGAASQLETLEAPAAPGRGRPQRRRAAALPVLLLTPGGVTLGGVLGRVVLGGVVLGRVVLGGVVLGRVVLGGVVLGWVTLDGVDPEQVVLSGWSWVG